MDDNDREDEERDKELGNGLYRNISSAIEEFGSCQPAPRFGERGRDIIKKFLG